MLSEACWPYIHLAYSTCVTGSGQNSRNTLWYNNLDEFDKAQQQLSVFFVTLKVVISNLKITLWLFTSSKADACCWSVHNQIQLMYVVGFVIVSSAANIKNPMFLQGGKSQNKDRKLQQAKRTMIKCGPSTRYLIINYKLQPEPTTCLPSVRKESCTLV